jgi:hypothetical protein
MGVERVASLRRKACSHAAGVTVAGIPLDDQMREWWDLGADLNDGSIQADTLRASQRKIRADGLALMRRATGPDLKLSNFYRRKRRSEAADISFQVERIESKLKFEPAGLWGLVESGARPHSIPKGAGKRLLVPIGPDRVVRGPIRHKGMASLGRPVRDTLRTIMGTWSAEFEKQIDRRV